MNRRRFLTLSPIAVLFHREPDNCGIVATRNADGSITLDGSNCELKRPKNNEFAMNFKNFTLK